MRQYKTLNANKDVDLISYVRDYLTANPTTEVIISCDSQNRRRETVYAIVIGLYKPKKGAHVLYTRFTTKREKDNAVRLLAEVWNSVEIAELVKNETGIIAKWIDLDLNEDKKYKSNAVLRSAVGLVEGYGFKARHKGLFPMLSYAADNLVK